MCFYDAGLVETAAVEASVVEGINEARPPGRRSSVRGREARLAGRLVRTLGARQERGTQQGTLSASVREVCQLQAPPKRSKDGVGVRSTPLGASIESVFSARYPRIG